MVFLLDQHIRKAAGRTAEPAAAKPGAADPLEMVRVTLDRMARGGIRDHLAGGYHRYSTDRSWTVPHFEKMLYDNAQLASVHLSAFEVTRDPRWRAEAEATFAFVERSMTAPEGGFYSALDAETKAGEGAYYVWTRDEVKSVLGDGPDASAFLQVYGLTGEPNFEGGRYVLREPRSRAEQAEALKTTPAELEARLGAAPRAAAGRSGAAAGAAARRQGPDRLERPDDRRVRRRLPGPAASRSTAARPRPPPTSCCDGSARPTAACCGPTALGQAKLPAYLEDYAFLAHGLLRLHAATGDARWLREARALADRMIADFEDREDGGFFFTADGHESLLARPKDPFDNALPSGNTVAILDLLALHKADRRIVLPRPRRQGPARLRHADGPPPLRDADDARRASSNTSIRGPRAVDPNRRCRSSRTRPMRRPGSSPPRPAGRPRQSGDRRRQGVSTPWSP